MNIVSEIPVKFTSKGLQIAGLLGNPNSIPKGIVIFSHGFLIGKDDNYELYKDLSHYFLERNFITLRFDFRGVGESEGKSEIYSLSSQMEDIESAIKFLYNTIVKKKEVILVGHSYGGVSAILATQRLDCIKALVILSSNINLKSKWTTKEIEDIEKNGFLFWNDKKIGIRMWHDVKNTDLIETLRKITKPVLVIQGTRDTYSSEKDAYDIFDNLKTKKEIKTVEGADHFYTGDMRQKICEYIFEWVKSI